MRKRLAKTARHFKPRRCIWGGPERHSVTTIGNRESDLKRQNLAMAKVLALIVVSCH
jgi:hypothetical protein